MTYPRSRLSGAFHPLLEWRARRALGLIALAALIAVGFPFAGEARATARIAPPRLLPGDAQAAEVRADSGRWLVGARETQAARSLARRFGARRLTPRGTYLVPRGRARAFAAALRARGLYVFSEPNRLAEPSTHDVFEERVGYWRDAVVDPALGEPPVTPSSPLLALIDSAADPSHPEFEGGNFSVDEPREAQSDHGTATAAIAAAPVNGRGIVGLWPGMRAVNLPFDFTCADSAAKLARAVALGAATINMSYGGEDPSCFAEYVELQFAIGQGVVSVAAAGNEFEQGNPLTYPALLPHVLTIASVGQDLRSSLFSNANPAVDLSAPGEGILTAVPLALDEEQPLPDGYAALDGTSFSAPMVAAAATWIRAARPELSGNQIGQLLRESATDLQDPGYDNDTGFGLLNLRAALTAPAPPHDPLEPNDDIVWIDGRAFARPDRPIYRGGRRRALGAFVDQYEDPDDVYRVVLPPRSRLRITLKPRFGDADLEVFGRRAKTVFSRRHRIARSRRNGTRRDRVTLVNSSRSRRRAYVHVYIDRVVRQLDARYRLSVRRLRFR